MLYFLNVRIQILYIAVYIQNSIDGICIICLLSRKRSNIMSLLRLGRRERGRRERGERDGIEMC